MRLDRLITLGFVKPLIRSRRQSVGLPVLMYHRIAGDPEPGVSPYYRVCTSPRRFAEHMQWLADWGWRGVSLREGLAWLQAARTPAPKAQTPMSAPPAMPVAITFDDGFRDFHTEAFPVLRRHGFSATMYLPSAFIGDNRRCFKSHECLSWPEVRELHSAGIEFGSHTVNHPILVRLGWPDIERELCDSRRAIEENLGHAICSFAYPYAFPSADRPFSTHLRGVLQAAGYTSCVTTEIGTVAPGDDPLQLCRLPANECDDDRLLRAKLAGAYDWLRGVQGLAKRFKPARIADRRNGGLQPPTPRFK